MLIKNCRNAMNLNAKVAAYIGFSVKSGKILYGYESVIAAKKARLVLFDPALSEHSRKKIRKYAETTGVSVVELPDLADYCGGRKVKCIGLVDENLASATEKELLGRR